jgi:hypothetical protein
MDAVAYGNNLAFLQKNWPISTRWRFWSPWDNALNDTHVTVAGHKAEDNKLWIKDQQGATYLIHPSHLRKAGDHE